MLSHYDKELIDEMMQREIGYIAWEHLKKQEFDYKEIAKTRSVQVLSEIRKVLVRHKWDGDDFEAIEKIVQIFEKYGLSAGNTHDFG